MDLAETFDARLLQKIEAGGTSLSASEVEILDYLSQAIEYREDTSGKHPCRVGYVAGLLTQEIGMGRACAKFIENAAKLHDIGKVIIPDSVLLKPGKLTAEEFEQLKEHTTAGARILAGGQQPLLQVARQIALSHHEEWDGSGYPHGFLGTEIPLVGRIASVADVFDALTHNRSYRKALSLEMTLELIRNERGRKFDPEVVDALLRVAQREEVLTVVEERRPTASPIIEKFLDASARAARGRTT